MGQHCGEHQNRHCWPSVHLALPTLSLYRHTTACHLTTSLEIALQERLDPGEHLGAVFVVIASGRHNPIPDYGFSFLPASLKRQSQKLQDTPLRESWLGLRELQFHSSFPVHRVFPDAQQVDFNGITLHLVQTHEARG